MAMIDIINEEIKNSIKSKNVQRLNVVRMLKAKILNVNARGDVSEDEAIKIFRNYAKNLKETIDISRKNNKEDVAKETEEELKIVNEYLPQEMSIDQVKSVITEVIGQIGKDKTKFGLIMKESLSRLKGQADGNIVKDIVNSLLN